MISAQSTHECPKPPKHMPGGNNRSKSLSSVSQRLGLHLPLSLSLSLYLCLYVFAFAFVAIISVINSLPADSLSPSGKHANFAVEQANT